MIPATRPLEVAGAGTQVVRIAVDLRAPVGGSGGGLARCRRGLRAHPVGAPIGAPMRGVATVPGGGRRRVTKTSSGTSTRGVGGGRSRAPSRRLPGGERSPSTGVRSDARGTRRASVRAVARRPRNRRPARGCERVPAGVSDDRCWHPARRTQPTPRRPLSPPREAHSARPARRRQTSLPRPARGRSDTSRRSPAEPPEDGCRVSPDRPARSPSGPAGRRGLAGGRDGPGAVREHAFPRGNGSARCPNSRRIAVVQRHPPTDGGNCHESVTGHRRRSAEVGRRGVGEPRSQVPPAASVPSPGQLHGSSSVGAPAKLAVGSALSRRARRLPRSPRSVRHALLSAFLVVETAFS